MFFRNRRNFAVHDPTRQQSEQDMPAMLKNVLVQYGLWRLIKFNESSPGDACDCAPVFL